ncbi:MAG: VWA domain-containing protein [Actinomycetales bacterium]|nr:substrate-binding domain-containing protein [Tetrasphaera sp.]NLW98250.1 VWA domain-containing protein [Actinomycetales bacterium]
MTQQPRTRSGRHASTSTRRDPQLIAIVVVVALVAVLGLGFLVTRLIGGDGAAADDDPDIVQAADGDSSGCETTTRVDVVADPAISTAVASALAPLANSPSCIDAQVAAQASDLAADAISRPEGVGLGGSLPDVWIPSSSLWVAQARSTDAGAARLTGDPAPLARSPIVVAAKPETASALGWPDAGTSWKALVEGGATSAASADPRSDTAALSALIAATGGSPTPEVVAAMSPRLAVPPAQGRSPAQMVLEDVAAVMPTSELDVIRTQVSGDRPGALSVAYDESLGSLDFPLVTVAGDSEVGAEAVEAISERLRSEQSLAAFSELGLRTVDGGLADRYHDGFGVDAGASAPEPAAAEEAVRGALDAWAVAGRRARILVVVDRSGSMLNAMPGGTVPKATLARDSIVQLVSSASPDTEVGLWSFTTNRGDAFIEELAPIEALSTQSTGSSHRDRLAAGVTGIQPIPTGDTPLFQVVLDAYQRAQENYSWGRLNAVVIVTDGKNDHPSGTLTEEQTLDQLRRLYDGMRPVRILALGYGPETDLAGLTRLADVTGGLAFQGLTEQEAATLLARTLPEL